MNVPARTSAQAAARGHGDRLARARMAAGGVGPQPARVVLVVRAALQQHLAVAVEHEHAERAVQQPPLVRIQLGRLAHLPVVLVDQHHHFVCVYHPELGTSGATP